MGKLGKILVDKMNNYQEYFGSPLHPKLDKKEIKQKIKDMEGMSAWNYIFKTGFYSHWNDDENDD